MSEIFRKAIVAAYTGILPEETINKMLLADLDKEIAENEIKIALFEKMKGDRKDQRREQDLHNGNLQKDKI